MRLPPTRLTGKNRTVSTDTTGWLLALALALLLCGQATAQNPPPPPPDNSTTEPGAPQNMSSVSDVLKGQQFLLKEDDVTLLTVYQSGSATNTDLLSFPTLDSHFGNEQTVNLVSSGNQFPSSGIQAAAVTGRMYNIDHDVVEPLAQQAQHVPDAGLGDPQLGIQVFFASIHARSIWAGGFAGSG